MLSGKGFASIGAFVRSCLWVDVRVRARTHGDIKLHQGCQEILIENKEWLDCANLSIQILDCKIAVLESLQDRVAMLIGGGPLRHRLIFDRSPK